MHRTLTTRAYALGLIALFHVAVFSDVAMLLCAPQGGTSVAAVESSASDLGGHAAHHSMAHAASDSEQGDDDPAPQHDHDSCNFCCPHGRFEAGSATSLLLAIGEPTAHKAPVASIELSHSSIPHLHTLPNPPPVA